jgi:hypothetical protein
LVITAVSEKTHYAAPFYSQAQDLHIRHHVEQELAEAKDHGVDLGAKTR